MEHHFKYFQRETLLCYILPESLVFVEIIKIKSNTKVHKHVQIIFLLPLLFFRYLPEIS